MNNVRFLNDKARAHYAATTAPSTEYFEVYYPPLFGAAWVLVTPRALEALEYGIHMGIMAGNEPGARYNSRPVDEHTILKSYEDLPYTESEIEAGLRLAGIG